MEILWLEQSGGDVPLDNDWLGPEELSHLESLQIPKRRSDWRLGRWTAKIAVASALQSPIDCTTLRSIVIMPASTGEPVVRITARSSAVTISISHRNSLAICSVALGSIALGCDLELVEPKSSAFIADYFTLDEQDLVNGSDPTAQPFLASLLWSAKESALKALHVGLRADTRSVVVDVSKLHGLAPTNGSWHELLVCSSDATEFRGWWRCANGVLRSIVAHPVGSLSLATLATRIDQPPCDGPVGAQVLCEPQRWVVTRADLLKTSS